MSITTTVLGGGSWTCEKCGKTIFGTSIYHQCLPPDKTYDNLFPNFKRKTKDMETFNYDQKDNEDDIKIDFKS